MPLSALSYLRCHQTVRRLIGTSIAPSAFIGPAEKLPWGISMAERSTHFIDIAVPVTRSKRDLNREPHPNRDFDQHSGRDSETVTGLLHRLTVELSTLFRQELMLAGAEISRSLTDLFLSLASVISGGAVLYAGFLVLLFSAVFGLAYVLPIWLAALVVGLAVALIGVVMVLAGRKKLKGAELVPRHTAESLRRDKEVLTRSRS